MLKKIAVCAFVILFSVSAYNCGPCNEQCVHGDEDDNCNCQCDSGWVGVACDQPSGSNLISAEVNYSGYFMYQTNDIEITPKIHNPGDDTLFIDSETAFGEWMYLRLIVDDLHSFSNKKYPITPSSLKNEVWFTHINPSITTAIFSPVITKPIAGYFEIDSFNVSPLYLKAKFSASLYALPSDTCFVKNGTIEYLY